MDVTPRLSQDQIVAERELLFEPRDGDRKPELVRFRLGRPVQGGKDWYCPFEVDGLGETRVELAYGGDSVQALVLALAKLRVVLGTMALDHDGTLEFAGRLGPGLPSLFEDTSAEGPIAAADAGVD